MEATRQQATQSEQTAATVPIAVFCVSKSLIRLWRIAGVAAILIAVVLAVGLLLQGEIVIALALVPLVSLAWLRGHFSNRPDIEVYDDHLNYRGFFRRHELMFSQITSMALAEKGTGRHRVTVLHSKDANNRVTPLFVPDIHDNYDQLVPLLEKVTGRKSVGLLSSAEFRRWKKASTATTVLQAAPQTPAAPPVPSTAGSGHPADRIAELPLDSAGRVDFPELSRRAFGGNGTRDDIERLWRAAFALKEWVFLARGEPGNPTPYVAQANQIEPETWWLYAFTDSDKVVRFAKENGFDKDGTVLYLTFPNPSDPKTIDTVMSYQQYDVKGIYFNCLDSGFYAPLANLRGLERAVNCRAASGAAATFS